MPRSFFFFVFGSALLLSACDGSTPAEVEDPVDDAVLQELAVSAFDAAEQDGAPLPSLQKLLRETYRAIRLDPEANSEGIAFLKRARAQAREAKTAEEAGDVEGAKAHSARSHALTLGAIISVLGEDVPVYGLAGVDQALSHLDARLEGKTIPERYVDALGRVRSLSERGHSALAGGNHRAALDAALRAADLLRAIVPRYQAERMIHRANRALSAAYELVAGTPTEQEKAALQKARSLLSEAKEAFRTRDFRVAVLFARESASLSLGVLENGSSG